MFLMINDPLAPTLKKLVHLDLKLYNNWEVENYGNPSGFFRKEKATQLFN